MSKWALVTGAAKRIGRAIALELADAGYDIVVHYNTSGAAARQLAKQIRDGGRQACLAEIDLANGTLTRRLIPSLTKAIGPLAVLVNNAGLFEPTLRHDRHRVVNTTAPRILSEVFHQCLREGQQGSIVNMLDANPTQAAFAGYNSSKIALAHMTRDMAQRFAPFLRVNGVALGAVLPSPRESAEHFQRLVESSPLGIQISPEAVAITVRFLLKNPFITGEVVHVDGGAHLCKMGEPTKEAKKFR
jgi:NAD(P)-dependent dehydrogenase (short-subunit alcohol dehydrogenase family)